VANSMNKVIHLSSVYSKDDVSHNPKDVSLCVQCGKCKALCPTYIESSSEVLGSRGRAAILKKFNQGDVAFSKRLYESLSSCILCEACSKSCPLQINIADAVYRSRKMLRGFDKKTILLNYILKFALKNPSRTFKIFKLLKIISDIPKVEMLYPFRYFNKLGVTMPDLPFKDKTTVFRASSPKGRIAVFTGCVINCLYPSYGKSLINLLNSLRYDVILPHGEFCCGAPLLELGLEEDAMKLAEMNLYAFKNLNVEYTISLCPTCIHFIKNIYKRYLGNSIDNAIDISQFLIEKSSGFPELAKKIKATLNPYIANTIYHDPCHSKYSLGIFSEPRYILGKIGFNLTNPSEVGCCGLGGAFGFLFEGLSDGILQNRLESFKEADMIITSCPNCVLQLKSKIKDRQVTHIIDVIAGFVGKNNT